MSITTWHRVQHAGAMELSHRCRPHKAADSDQWLLQKVILTNYILNPICL